MSMHEHHSQIRPIRWPLVRWALAAALLAAPVLAGAHEKAASPTPASSSAAPMDHSRMGHMDSHAGMSMTGDVNYDFAVNMRKHHQMALMMAEAQLEKGNDAKLRPMAIQIIATQKKEIAELDSWIASRDQAKASPSAN